jgi:hypothetical protein
LSALPLRRKGIAVDEAQIDDERVHHESDSSRSLDVEASVALDEARVDHDY